MATDPNIKSDIQKLAQGSPYVELFTIDLNPIQQAITYNFTAGPIGGVAVTFNSITYSPVSLEAKGFDVVSDGKFPRPHIIISNINRLLVGSVVVYRDLVGCKVTRIRTYKKYLDGQAEANPSAIYRQDTYYINKKVSQNKFMIEWELISPIEAVTLEIPAKQLVDTCTHRYRVLDNAGDPVKAGVSTCPFALTNYYLEDGTPTGSPELDKCGKDLSSCRTRFGSDVYLPYEGFPNMKKFAYSYGR